MDRRRWRVDGSDMVEMVQFGPPPAAVTLRLTYLLRGALAVALGLAVAHFVAVFLAYRSSDGPEVRDVVNLDAEQNPATWFSSSLLLVNAALLAVLVANAERAERSRWALLTAMVLAVSVDEVIGLHERANTWLRGAVGGTGLLTFVWVIPAAVVVAAVGMICIRPLLRRPGGGAVVAGVVVFLLGALAVEMVGGWRYDQVGSQDDLGYLLLAGVEETMEMLGAILAMGGLMRMTSGLGMILRWD